MLSHGLESPTNSQTLGFCELASQEQGYVMNRVSTSLKIYERYCSEGPLSDVGSKVQVKTSKTFLRLLFLFQCIVKLIF